MKQRLINHIQSIRDSSLRRTCESILTFDKFFTCPASLSFHHAYEGGLLAHTVEVCDIALSMSSQPDSDILGRSFQEPNHDTTIAAALWHDFCKTREYEITTMGRGALGKGLQEALHTSELWNHTDYGRKIHHIAGSAIEFHRIAHYNNVDTGTIDAVIHCILAHHGRKEWGSPVEPQTIEALILHQADMLSAKFGATKDAIP